MALEQTQEGITGWHRPWGVETDECESLKVWFSLLQETGKEQKADTSVHHLCECMLSLAQLFVTTWTVAHQDPVHEIFSRQENWSGLPFTSPGDLPDPGIENAFPASSALAGRFFTTEPPGKPLILCKYFTASLRWLTGFKDKQMLVQPMKGHWHYLKLQRGIWLLLLNCPINSRGVLQATGSWFGSKQLFLKPLLHCGLCITNILAQRHPFRVLTNLFLFKVSPRLVFYTRMITVTADKSSLMAKNTVVSDAPPESTLWRLRMFVLVGKRRQHSKVSKKLLWTLLICWQGIYIKSRHLVIVSYFLIALFSYMTEKGSKWVRTECFSKLIDPSNDEWLHEM